MKPKHIKRYLPLTGLFLLAYVLWTCRAGRALTHLRSLHPAYWLLVAAMVVLVLYLKTWRWRSLLVAQGITDLSHSRLLLIYAASFFWGLVTPSHIGELSKIAYLARFGHSANRTLLNSLLDRLFDVVVLVAYGTAGLAFFLYHRPSGGGLTLRWTIGGWTLIAVGTAAVLLIVLLARLRPAWIEHARKLASDTWRELRGARRRYFVLAAAITLLAWGVQLAVYVAVGRALHLGISSAYLVAVVPAASFAAMLPVSVGGLGVREGTVVGLLHLVGVAPDLALAFAGTFIVVNLLNLALGFVGWTLVRHVLPPTQQGTQP